MISRKELIELNVVREIIKEYPESGQKKVFLAKEDGYEVIVKIVQFNNERVKREIDIICKNSLTNVPKILSVSEFTSRDNKEYLCIKEEYIDGPTLEAVLANNKLNLRQGLKLLKTLLKISIVLEEKNIVHRDIKPSNIISAKSGDFYLIDFGIARILNQTSLTQSEAAVGPHTPGYGAPELFQYSKENITIKSDLFSIGVVMFESLTGLHPFLRGDEANVNEIWYRTKTVIPIDYIIKGDNSKQLISFIQTLMQKHTSRRPPSARKAYEWFQVLLPTIVLEETSK